MNNDKIMARFWFNDRALYYQWPFWIGLAITLLPLLFAAWRILSPYELGLSPEAVLFFFEKMRPLIPWFAAIIAVAALLARMHATVQTKAQIDASRSDAIFGNYLKHREYVREGIRNSSVHFLRRGSVDFQRLYKVMFPFNGFSRIDLSCGPFGKSADVFDSFESRICQEINHGKVYYHRRDESVWSFQSDFLYQTILSCLGELGLTVPSSFRDFSGSKGSVLGNGIVTTDQLVDMVEHFEDCLNELMQISQKVQPGWLNQLVVFAFALRADGGLISEESWEIIAPEFCK